MMDVHLGPHHFRLPEAWPECRSEQIARLAHLRAFADPGEFSTWSDVLCCLLGATVRQWAGLRLSVEQYNALRDRCQWVFSDPVAERPFPEFQLEGRTYYLPDAELSTATALEVSWLHIWLVAYTRPHDPDPDAGLRLLALLARPARPDLKRAEAAPDWNGDRREPFNLARCEARAEVFRALPLGIAAACLFYAVSVAAQFVAAYDAVFAPADPKRSDGAEADDTGEGWLTTLMHVAQEGTFGPYERVCQTNAHEVYLYLRHKTQTAASPAPDDVH